MLAGYIAGRVITEVLYQKGRLLGQVEIGAQVPTLMQPSMATTAEPNGREPVIPGIPEQGMHTRTGLMGALHGWYRGHVFTCGVWSKRN